MTAVPSDPRTPAPLRTSFPSGADPAPEGVADLHAFLDDGLPPGERRAPRRSRELAAQLLARLAALPGRPRRHTASLPQRLVTDDVLRAEADKDQNVYLGAAFTRFLSNALPDVVFLPATVAEVEVALAWARDTATTVAVRGAASTALGGAVPCDGGLTLDLSRLDHIDVDVAANVCVIGAGARLRAIHRRLASLFRPHRRPPRLRRARPAPASRPARAAPPARRCAPTACPRRRTGSRACASRGARPLPPRSRADA